VLCEDDKAHELNMTLFLRGITMDVPNTKFVSCFNDTLFLLISRIVTVSSMLHERGIIDFDNLNGEKGFVGASQRMNPAYCNSKLANMLFNVELSKRIKGSGVDSFALCPGFVYTKLFRYTTVKWYHYILFLPVALFFMRTPSQV